MFEGVLWSHVEDIWGLFWLHLEDGLASGRPRLKNLESPSSVGVNGLHHRVASVRICRVNRDPILRPERSIMNLLLLSDPVDHVDSTTADAIIAEIVVKA